MLCIFGAHAAPHNAAHDDLDLLLIQRGVVQAVVDVGQKVGAVGQNVGSQASDLVVNAMGYLGAPYRRGGTGINGFDCSGFVKHVYEHNGVHLPRTVSEMKDTLMPVPKNNIH